MGFWDVAVRAFAALLMLSLPIFVAVYLRRTSFRTVSGSSWGVFGMGALCFVTSQIIHVPLNYLVLMPLSSQMFGIHIIPNQKPSGASLVVLSFVLGLSAGLCEEVSRWLFFRCWLRPKSDSFPSAIMFGVGHGGCEAFIVGIGAMASLVAMIVFRDQAPDNIPQQAVDQYWALSGLQIIMGPLERVFAMTFHVACSLLVWQAIVLQKLRWLVLAVVLHMALDAIYVLVVVTWGVIASEIVIACSCFPMSIYIIHHYVSKNAEHPVFQPLPECEDHELPDVSSEDEGTQLGAQLDL